MIKKIVNMIMQPFLWLARLIISPFTYLKRKAKERRENQDKLTRLNLTRDYIHLAREEQLEIMITANYDNEFIVNLMTKEAKKGMVKKKKEKEKKEV